MNPDAPQIVMLNPKGLFVRGSTVVLVTTPVMEQISRLRSQFASDPDQAELFAWGCSMLVALPIVSGSSLASHLPTTDGLGMFLPSTSSSANTRPIPQMGTTPADFGWDAIRAIHAERARFRQFIKLVNPRHSRPGLSCLAEIIGPYLTKKVPRLAEIKIDTLGFTERFVATDCYVVYGQAKPNAYWLNPSSLTEGFLKGSNELGDISTARPFASPEAALRSLKGAAFLDPDSSVVIQAGLHLQDVHPSTAVNLARLPSLAPILAAVRKRAIQDALAQASAAELKARLDALEQAHPELTPAHSSAPIAPSRL